MTRLERHVRTIYLYLFALLGLIFLAIGSIRLIDMGLRTVIFREADAQERLREMPPLPAYARGRLDVAVSSEELTPDEREQVRIWLEDYRAWKERSEAIDPVVARRHREAASSLAMILVGLPLYWFHWRRIRIETAERRQRAAVGAGGR